MESTVIPQVTPELPKFLTGGGELGALIRNYDWSASALGSPETWPQSLRMAIRMMLVSSQPIWVGWGRDLIKFYNDPYKAIVGGKHPWALGTPLAEVWKEIWPGIAPLLESVMEKNEGVYIESQLLIMERNGYPEETYYTYAFTPLEAEDGTVGGIICTNTDDTEKVMSARQLKTLSELGQNLTDALSPEDIIGQTMAALKNNPHDFPFALFYTVGENEAVLAGSSEPIDGSWFPEKIALNDPGRVACLLADTVATRRIQTLQDLGKDADKLPKGAWQDSPDKIIAIPILQNYSKDPLGLLVVGCNPYRLLDERYQSLLSLVADYVTGSFSNIQILQEVRKSQQQYQRLFLQAPAIINILTGPDHRFALFHPKNKEILGDKDYTGLSVREALPELQGHVVMQMLDDVYRTGRTVTMDEVPVELRNADGEMVLRYFNILYQPLRGMKGEIEGILNFALDVTETVLSRKRIEQSGTEMKFVTDMMPQLVWATEANGYSSFFNKGWMDYTGLSFDDVKGDGWTQSLHPDDYEHAFRIWRNAVELKGDYEVEYRLRRYDGEYRWFVARGVPMKDEQGNIVKWYGTTTDIHEHKLAADALRRSHERFDLVSRATQDAIWDWNLLTNEVVWNDAIYTLFGYGQDEVKETADWWVETIHPDDRDRVSHSIHGVIDAAGDSWAEEYRFRCSDGTYKTVFDRGFLIHDENGKSIRMLGSMQDITDRKRAETILAGQKQAFEQAVDGADLHAVLDTIIQTAEKSTIAPVKASLLLLDKEGKHLLHGAAPSLDKAYNDAIHGIEIGPDVGSCGTAAYFGREVVVSDIATDPLWKNFKDLALAHGLHACWSTPIFSSSGKVLGTFAFYYGNVHTPSQQDIEIVSMLSKSAGLIVEWYQNIEERQEAEKAVLESEQRFRALADQSPMIVYIVEPNAEATMSYFNKQWLDYTGQTFAEALGRAWDGIVHPDDVQQILDIYVPAFEKRQSYTLPEVRLRRHDGVYRWHTFKGNPRFMPTGEFMGYVGVGIDIHERKLAEESLQQSEEQFRTLADSIQNLAWMADAEGSVYWYNNRWYEYTGSDFEKMKGTGWQQVVHAEHAQEVIRTVAGAWKKGEPFELTFPMRRHDDEYRWFLVRVHPVKDSKGKVMRWVGTNTDIDDQKTIAEKLENLVAERTRELQRSNQDLQQFAHVASHDLKEPVRKIKTFATRLQDEYSEVLPDQGKSFVTKVQHATDRMIAMIEGVLSYSKIDSEQQAIEDIDLNEVFANVETDLELLMQQKGAKLTRGRLVSLQGASVLIYQLFYNLINNSLKFAKQTEAPVIAVSAWVNKEDDTEFAYIRITDNGIGFHPEQADKIFNTFTRLHSKDKYEGTGLGLSLCKKIAERHGGRIEATGERNKGATFTVVLPVKHKNVMLQ